MPTIPSVSGRYLTVKDGFIVNDRQHANLQDEWKAIIVDLVALIKLNEMFLDSIYIRGSVSDGKAIKGISDIDCVAIIDSPTDKASPLPYMLACAWVEDANKKLKSKYPFCDGIDIYLLPKTRVLHDAKSAFYIKTQSLCVYGEDISAQLSDYRIGSPATLSHSLNLQFDLDYIKNKITESSSPEFIKSCCKKIMKRLVRSALEICIPSSQQFTRDLYLCYSTFEKCYPDGAAKVYTALYYALNPTSEVEFLLRILAVSLGRYLPSTSKSNLNIVRR